MTNDHSPQMSLVVAVAAIGATLLVPAVAQEFTDSDTREIASYVLTEAGLAKYTQATRTLGALPERPSDSCEAADNAESLDELIAAVDATPGARAAIQSAGMTTREYVVFTWSLLQNGLAAWAVSQPGGQLPPGTSMANVQFYRAHEAALQALGSQVDADGCDEGDDENSDEDDSAENQ